MKEDWRQSCTFSCLFSLVALFQREKKYVDVTCLGVFHLLMRITLIIMYELFFVKFADYYAFTIFVLFDDEDEDKLAEG